MLTNKDTYILTMTKSIPEAKEILLRNTLIRSTLGLENTVKPFIGKISNDSFFVMLSIKPFIFSTLNGQFENTDENTNIVVETKIPKVFFRLYVFAVIAISIPVFLPFFIDPNLSLSIIPFIQWPIFALLFHLLLRGGYLLSRNKGIKELEMLLC